MDGASDFAAERTPMMVVVRIVGAILLLAHSLVHLLYPAPDVAEFSTRRSWLVPEAARQPVALALMAATIAASAALALAVWGVPGLAAAWPVFGHLRGSNVAGTPRRVLAPPTATGGGDRRHPHHARRRPA